MGYVEQCAAAEQSGKNGDLVKEQQKIIEELENKLDGFLDRHLTIVEKLLELNKEVKE